MVITILVLAALLVGGTVWASDKAETKPQTSFREMLDIILRRVDLKGMSPRLVKAVAILETGNGKETGLGVHHNLFNIHAVGPANAFWNGNAYRVGDELVRMYPTFDDSVRDFVRLISTQPRYGSAFILAQAGNSGFFLALEQAGYANTSGYGDSVLRVYRSL